MRTKITIRSIYAWTLIGWVGVAPALSLGSLSGSAVIGRPLDVAAAIQSDEPGAGSGCVSVDVLYGDQVVDRANVQVQVTQDAARRTSLVRISATSPVNEPFVTVVVRAGCAAQSVRRYVLLADAPKGEPMVLVAAPSATIAEAPDMRAIAGSPKVTGPAAVTPGTRLSSRGAMRATSTAARVTAPRRSARLQLAVWDPASEGMPWLRASTALGSTPTGDAGHRAAALALWRALNAQPQDLLRTAEQLATLETEVNSLRSLAAAHRLEISTARESLEATNGQVGADLTLAAMLAMFAGGGTAFLWKRSRRLDARRPSSTWYGSLGLHADAEPVFDDEDEPAPMPQSHAAAETARLVEPQAVAPAKLTLVPPLHAPLEFTLPDPPAPALPAAPEQKVVGLNVDALHGVQQQAEFFVSLGQFDEAIAVLSAYLEECSEKPVLAFLELFRIYHALEMREEYEALGSRFRRTFGIDAMSFADYRDDRRELELYPVAVGRVAAAWPSAESQEVIEDLLFRKPAAPRDLLSLAAYRELIWLYSLGQDIVCNTSLPAGLQLLRDRSLSNDHFILPWATSHREDAPELSLDRLHAIEVAPELNAFAVDIDLTARGDAFPPADAGEPSPPEPRPAPPLAVSTEATDAFDAVMEAVSRRKFP